MKPIRFNTIAKIEYAWWALLSSAFAILGTALDRGVISVVLPDIAEDFSSDIPTAQWVIVIYLLVLTALLLPMGRLSDAVGKKRVIILGLLIFSFGGVVCCFSQTFPLLLTGRISQGIGGAMVQGTSFAIAVAAFGEGQRGKAVGLVMIFVGLGSIAGPAVGGFAASLAGWRSVFILTSAITGAGAILATAVLRDERSSTDSSDSKFDWIGSLLFISSLGSLLTGITMAIRSTWSPLPTAVGICSALIFGFFYVIRSLRAQSPLFDVRLFKSPLFACSVAAILLGFIGTSAANFLLPFYLKYGLGYSPREVGIVFVPAAAAMSILSPFSGKLSDVHGTKLFASGGLFISTIGLLSLSALNLSSHGWMPLLAMIPVTAGLGIFYGPNNSATLSVAKNEVHGSVIGLINLVRNSGNLIAIPVSTIIVTAVMSSLGYAPDLSEVTYNSDKNIIGSFVSGMRVAFLILAGITFLGSMLSFYDNKLPTHKTHPYGA